MMISLKNGRLFYKILKELLEELLLNGLINLRMLLKHAEKKISLHNYRFFLSQEKGLAYMTDFRILILFSILTKIMGTESNIYTALQALSNRRPYTKKGDIEIKILEEIITFLDYQQHGGQATDSTYFYISNDVNISIEYHLIGRSYDDPHRINITDIYPLKDEDADYNHMHNTTLPLFPLFLLAFKKYQSLKKID